MDTLPAHLFRDIFDLTPCASVAWLSASSYTLHGVGNTFPMPVKHKCHLPGEFHFVPPHVKQLSAHRWIATPYTGGDQASIISSRLGRYVTGNRVGLKKYARNEPILILAWAMACNDVRMCCFWKNWVLLTMYKEVLHDEWWTPQLGRSFQPYTLLQIAASYNSVAACEWLRENGMTLQDVYKNDSLALTLALDNNSVGVCYFFKAMGQDLKCCFDQDKTLWQRIARHADLSTFQMLKACGVISSTRTQAVSVLEAVMREGHLEMFKAFKEWINCEKIFLFKDDVSWALEEAAKTMRYTNTKKHLRVCEFFCQWLREMFQQ
jgi:hypothetical protein